MKSAAQRDVSRILKLANDGEKEVYEGGMGTTVTPHLTKIGAIFMRIAAIAKAIDARTGRRDPSVRKKGKSAGRKRVTR